MKVVITGANSAVGQAILRCGPAVGAKPIVYIAAVRSARAMEEIRPLVSDSSGVVQISYDDAKSLDTALQGADAVIHLAGILIETPGSNYEGANVASTRSVVEAAKRAGVRKFVLVSAIGADENSSNRYYRTKGQAEALARGSGLVYSVLRAPLLLGPGTAGSAALKRHASHAKAKLIGGGRNLQQPLHVGDLARGAVAAAEPSVAANLTLDFVGPLSIAEREIVERAAKSLGREVKIGSVPKAFLSFVLAIRKRLGKAGLSPDALEVILADTRLNPQPAATALGIQLTGMDEMIKNSVA